MTGESRPFESSLDPEDESLTASETGQPGSRPMNKVGDLPGMFGRYRVQKVLGAGATSTVYLAEDTALARLVALKIPRFHSDEDREFTLRFFREARVTAQLRHPNLCPIYDVGEIDGRLYLAMAYVPGKTLRDFIQPGKPLTEKQAMAIVRKIALAVHEAHVQGVIHRDLKPDNIMISERGEPIVMDFGMVREIDARHSAGLTQSGVFIGSPAYMSKEQIEGDLTRLSPATDQYSLGVILYQLLTSKLPFEGGLHAVLAAVLTKEPPPPHEFRSDLNPHLEAVCLRMMAKDPAQRYPSMQAVADAIADVSKLHPAVRDTDHVERMHLPAASTSVPSHPTSVTTPALPRGSVFIAIPAVCISAMKKAAAGMTSGIAAGVKKILAGKSVRRSASDSNQVPPLPPHDWSDSSGGDNVEVAVYAPPEVVKGDAVLIQVFCYALENAHEAQQLAVEFDEGTARRGLTTLAMPVQNGDRLQFHLTLNDIHIDAPHRQLIWNSRTSSVQFEIQIPKRYPLETLLGAVVINACGAPVGRIGFRLSVISKRARACPLKAASIGYGAEKFRKAFVSYSSKDRASVIARLQLLRPPLHQIEVFQDVREIEPGDDWNQTLGRRIEECDLFLLFWSTNASQSSFVKQEWEYALRRQGARKAPPPTILPVIIEGPPPPKAPDELSHLHFDDYLLYFTK